jgi:hypothetical protein
VIQLYYVAKKKRMPGPETFSRGEATMIVTFRLSETDHAALLQLAERGKIGHSTLVRRVVEHYIQEHAKPRARRG